ncbi:GTP-binding protein [Anoxynatronum sibiricum]|uniref:GTP-binding protein n=1 Tax=Anoxynatronum sibiricum TaxID=210623 RepID=A0ABU9VYY2_9CLOT
MRLVTVSGPPSSGKTSVIINVCKSMQRQGIGVGVVKMDCLTTNDDKLYTKAGIPVKVGLSGNLCPDHFFISNIEGCFQWGQSQGLDILFNESAGLCNRCSPHIKEVMGVCVIDNLMGVNTPQKIGPMLKLADVVIITKYDIVSQAEKEVFAFRVRQANPRAHIVHVNGITGQGAEEAATLLQAADEVKTLSGKRLRFSMPAALCSYCLGEVKIGADFQMGNVRKMQFHK